MLQKQTITNETLEILTALMCDPVLGDFVLVGGTALSLRLGHRMSIDLDLFSNRDFDNTALHGHLSGKYDFKADYIAKNTLKGGVNNIKIDFIFP